MKKIKVAQVITRLDWGGSPDIVRIICQHLSAEYDITLVTGQPKHLSAKTRHFLGNFKGQIIVIPQLKRDISPVNDLLAFIKLCLLLRREKFDIVHTHTAKAGVLARIAAYLSGKPIIVHTPHGHNFYGYFGPIISKIIILIERFVAHFTDRVIALTSLEKNDFLRFRIADAKRISLIYQGLEIDGYARQNIDKVKLRETLNIEPYEEAVGMIGRLEPVKGPCYFVESARYVAEKFPQTKFIVAGEGSLRKKLEKKVQELGLEDKFIFTGWREDIPEIISILSLLVSPSLNEAVGMVLIEAQAQGVPVVASNVGGIPEIVRDNETGILVPAADSQELARAINFLLSDKQRRSDMSERAMAWVRGRFEAKTMVNEISELYKELINRK